MITRELVRNQILAYLNRDITLTQLVDWAENAMNNGVFEPRDASLLTDIVARIGLADVEDFVLSWEDCHGFLSRLGYKVEVLAA